MSRGSDLAHAALRRAVLSSSGRDAGGILLRPDRLDYLRLEADVVRHEVGDVVLGPSPELGLQQLADEGALEALLPEVSAMVGFGEGAKHHKDVWDHTKRVVSQSPPRSAVRWAALLHDIGKVPTRRIEADGQIQFHGHAEVGARMVKKLLDRLDFPRDEAHHIKLLVLFHQRPSQYEPSWTDSAVRRFGKETKEVVDDLLDLSRADMTTKYEGKRRRGQELIDELTQRVREIQELDGRVPPLPKGLGLGIIERFSLRPGPRIGQLRNAVEAAVERGDLEAQQDIEVYLTWLEEHIDDA